jgi:hypothetical protein
MSPGARLLTALSLVLLATVMATVAALGLPPVLIVLCTIVAIAMLGAAAWLFFTALGSDALGAAPDDGDPGEDP